MNLTDIFRQPEKIQLRGQLWGVYLWRTLFISTLVILPYLSGEMFRESFQLDMKPLPNLNSNNVTNQSIQHPISSYDVIMKRALFGPATPVNAPPPPAPVTKLKLRLVGTNVSNGSKPLAIIEDTTKSDQDVFELNEDIFGQAKLMEVLPESVKIQYQGKFETLLLEDGDLTTRGSAPTGAGRDDETEFAVAESELTEALANLPLLLSQARAVPYFRNGQSVGMRLFAIRKESLYEKLGLRNGDIILSVNENSLSDPTQALKLFEQLKSDRSINLKLERNAEDKQFHYSIR
jgi:general secretion pathway protein C